MISDIVYFFLFSLIGVYEPDTRDKRSIIDIDFILSDKKRIMDESKLRVEDKVDEILNRRRTSDSEETLSKDSTDIFVFNKAPPLKNELEKTTVSTYHKSKLKINQCNSAKSFIFKNGGDGSNVFRPTKSVSYKRFFALF